MRGGGRHIGAFISCLRLALCCLAPSCLLLNPARVLVLSFNAEAEGAVHASASGRPVAAAAAAAAAG